MILQSLLYCISLCGAEGRRLLPWYLQVFSHPFPLPFSLHTWYHICLSKTKGNTKIGVGAKSQPQPWIRDLTHGMERYLHVPGTEKPKLRKLFRFNEIRTHKQCVPIRPDLTKKFERYCFIVDLKVDFSKFNGFKSLLTLLWPQQSNSTAW